MDSPSEAQDPLIALVHVALASDDPGRLVAAAEPELRRPLGLLDATGQVLGHAPDTDAGMQALAIARAAATSRLVAPPGWRIVPIACASSALGFPAVGECATPERAQERQLDLIAELLADQLQRRLLLQAHTTAFVQRLVSAPAIGAPHARRDAAMPRSSGLGWPSPTGPRSSPGAAPLRARRWSSASPARRAGPRRAASPRCSTGGWSCSIPPAIGTTAAASFNGSGTSSNAPGASPPRRARRRSPPRVLSASANSARASASSKGSGRSGRAPRRRRSR
jgi:hypothetical protein